MPLRKAYDAPFLHVGLATCAVLLLGQGASAAREREEVLALDALNKSAVVSFTETQIEPITLTILGGIAAFGSLSAIGKTVHGLVQNKKAILEAKGIIEKFGDVSTAGCNMLVKVGEILVAELRDLNKLTGTDQFLRACEEDGRFGGYFEVLEDELQRELWHVDAMHRAQFIAVYINGFNRTRSRVCDRGDKALQLKQKEQIVNRLWRMDGLLQGTCGQRMPALQTMNSLVQSNSKAQTSTGELFAALGLAFTVVAFVDMSVDIADSAINYMWGSSTKMLATFLERQLERMSGLFCNQSKALLTESALTLHAGRAVKRTNFEMELYQKSRVPFSKIPDIFNQAMLMHSEQIWGLEQDSVWLCHRERLCLVQFEQRFIYSKEREAAKVGYAHPEMCLAYGQGDKQPPMVAICSQNAQEIETAVPSSCFAVFMLSSGTNMATTRSRMGIPGRTKVEGVTWILQFYPSDVADPVFRTKPDLSLCNRPREEHQKLQLDLHRELKEDLQKTRQALSLDIYCSA